ncbi:Secretory lipase [Pelagibacterium luteolum]|uniref:Secretory lipase n=1 Tax=Pelagibacterium luteolum TaxID=440168 RepID=A0A1G7UF02_9HYPH|nr:Secretory lipase [Pelagibacterium luteolum]
MTGWDDRARGCAVRLVKILSWLVGLLVALALLGIVVAWVWARPDAVGDFLENAAVPQGAAAGDLIAVEPYSLDVPDGAEAWRIIYVTTREHGDLAPASAVVMTPVDAIGPLPMVSWAHGTTGVVAGCAPSVFAPFANVPGVPKLLDAGWAYVATDYVGLGTEGGHAYLVGRESAQGVLDAVRAAVDMDAVDLLPETVVWGHSQGGGVALWAGLIAPDYAPEITVAGVAGLAPASDLPALVETARSGLFGKIVSSYLMASYSQTYPEIDRSAYVGGLAGVLASDIAGRCVGGRETLFSVAETMLLPAGGIFQSDPKEGALGARLADNVPLGAYAMPVLVAQGDEDDLVLEPVQAGFVAQLCADGQDVDYLTFAGRDHVSLVAPDSPLIGPLMDWTAARFAGSPAEGCAFND